MKRMSVALVALIVMASGVYAAVTSVNIVGYNSITLEGGKRVIVSAPFYDPAGDGTNTLIGVFGTDQLLQSAEYPLADKVILWDTAEGKYQAYAQYAGNFYKCNTSAEWGPPAHNDVVLEKGSAFWLEHPEGATTRTIALLGEVLGGKTDTQEVAVVTGYQLASQAYAAEVAIQDIAKLADGATGNTDYPLADQIVVWDYDAQAYQAYALVDTLDTWYKANNSTEWGYYPASNSIAVGEGYWYIAKTNFPISRACPYSAAYAAE